MAAPQAGVQTRQDLSSYLIGNINDQNRASQAQKEGAFGDVMDFAKTAYGIGSDIYGKVREQEALKAKGLELKGQAILTRDGTSPPDRAWMRARMALSPELAKEMAELDRYQTKGTFAKDASDLVDTEAFLKQSFGEKDPKNIEIARAFAKQFGKTVDSSERKIIVDMAKVSLSDDLESQHANAYVFEYGGAGYMSDESEGDQTDTTQQGGLQDASLQPGTEGTATKGQSPTQTGQPVLEGQANSLLSNASGAASQAQGRMEPRGQVGATNRKPLILGMAPGMTTETVRQAQGTPQLQAAYAAAPSNLAQYWGVKPEAVQAAYRGLSETGLPTNPQQRQQVMASWAQQVQTALPGIFPEGQPPEKTVEEALSLRSGAAHTALASVLKGGQPVLPIGPDGQRILYVPNTRSGVQASPSPAAEPDNKVAQSGGLTPVGYSTGIQTRQGQGGVQLGVDEGILASAEAKRSQGQPLNGDEKLALSNLHKVASAHVKVNGDVLVRGVPLKDLVKNYDQRLPEIENGIRKLNGMGLTVEDMMDPTLTSFQGYMNLLKPAQAKFVEQNKPIQDLLNNIIQFKQDAHAQENIDLAGKSLDLQRQELAQRVDYQNKSLGLEVRKIAADEAKDGNGPNATAAQGYSRALADYTKAFTQYRLITKGMRQPDIDRAKLDPKTPIGQMWKVLSDNYLVVGNGRPLDGEPPDPSGGGSSPAAGMAASINAMNPLAAKTTQPQSSLSGTGTSTSNVDSFMSRYTTK